jgi:CelD/BcsL family acetyltransferase involved in cellulose biosynthesis
MAGIPMIDKNSLRIVLLKSQAELFQISSQWRELQAIARRSTVFQSWEWCYSWWEVFAGTCQELVVACVYDDDQLVMILPLAAKKDDQGVPILFLLACDVSDYIDFIVKPGYETAIGDILLKVMKQQRISWLEAKSFSTWGGLYFAITELRSKIGAHVYDDLSWQEPEYAQIIFPPTWEEYLSSCPPKHRRNISRALRDIDKTKLSLGCDDRPSPSLLNSVIDLHCQSMARRGKKSPFTEPAKRQFLECALQRLFRANKARLFTLTEGDALVGADIVLTDQTWDYGYLRALTDDYMKLSPGTAILADVIRVGIQEGRYGLDLGMGSEAYKSRWANSETPILIVSVEYTGNIKSLIRLARRQIKSVRDLYLSQPQS